VDPDLDWIRVRRSFSVRSEMMRKRIEKYFVSKRKNSFVSLVSLRSEKLEIISETKTNEAKKTKRNKKELKNEEMK
jgi:hypothetical protein